MSSAPPCSLDALDSQWTGKLRPTLAAAVHNFTLLRRLTTTAKRLTAPPAMLRLHLAAFCMCFAAFGCSANPSGDQPSTDTADPSGSGSTTSSPTTTTGAPACGDGVLDPGEQCDDGNVISDDGCENNCTETVVSPTCGDGEVNGTDECDDGNQINTDACTNTCKTATCGDSIVHDGAEQCDEGGWTANCNNDCTPAMCGDGLVNAEAGEECEDGNADDADTCLSTCKNAICGDMVIQTGVEECDDGTPDGDDLCNACKNEPYRYVFITAGVFSGDLNGVAGADSSCLIAANDANIPGAGDAAWTAWLSTNTNQVIERLDTTFSGWYVLPTEPPTLVAKGWAGLSSGSLVHAIDTTESGNAVSMPATAWTNTDTTGGSPAINLHCKNWNSMDPADTGRVGLSTALNGDWTDPSDPASVACSTTHHIYCIQDIP